MKVYNNLDEVAELIQAGKVGVIPTDTVYGLVAVASNQEAVARIYGIKGRRGKPGTIIAANIEQLVELGLKRRYLTAVEQYWPGPVSVKIPNHELTYLHLGLGDIAVRIPKNIELQALLSKTSPLQTSSANLTGQPDSITIKQAQDYFGNNVDFYVDGGDLSDRKPSTVLRIVDDAVEVIRQGAVKIDEQTGRILSK